MTHFDIDFADYPNGALSTSGSAWARAVLTANVEEDENDGDNKYLNLQAAGGAGTLSKNLTLDSLTNSNTGTESMVVAASTSYQWSFSFRLPSTVDPILIRLDTGAAGTGRYLAGMSITGTGQLQYMTDPNVAPLSGQMTTVSTSTFALEADEWYHVTFDITTGALVDGKLSVTSDFSIAGAGDSFSASASYTPSSLLLTDQARVIWGTRSATDPVNIHLDNLRLETIPEPGTVSLLVGAATLGFLARRKLLGKK